MKQKKPFEKLGFHDAFLFAVTMEDEEVCRNVLERILEIPIRRVKIHTERTMMYNSDYRGICMDVYADDEAGSVYNVEMQTTNKGNLPMRSRYYQSHIDLGLLRPGIDFKELPKGYVIFICTFDPFGRGLYRYTYQYSCQEDGGNLEDGTYKIFLNTQGTHPELVTEDLVKFLKFVETSELSSEDEEDSLLRILYDRVNYVKQSRRMEERYMLFEEMLREERQEGREEGREEGRLEAREELKKLFQAMTKDNRIQDIAKLGTDSQFFDSMMNQYGINKNQ